jgi:predicted dehydrogenase
MKNSRLLPRRAFLEKAATISAIGFAVPHLASAADPAPSASRSPNSRIHIGLIGCGHMGRVNLTNCAAHPDVVVTAACDADENRLEPTLEQFKGTCRGYRDYREMLQQRDLDAVIIGTLPHWHALQAIAACEAGKDLYIQKPMTLHLAESLAVRNAIKKHNRISQIGTQHHAREEHHRVVEYVRSGNLGPIGVARTFNVMNQSPSGIGTGGYKDPHDGLDWDLWCGPAPLGRYNRKLVADAYHHCSWMDYSGGWTPGNGPHMIDLPITALDLGYPTMVSSSGGRFVVQDDGDAYDQHEVLWRYANPNLTLTWMMSLTNSYGFDMQGDPKPRTRLGVYFHGTNGTLYADYLGNSTLVSEGDGLKDKPAPPKSIPPSPGQEREWLDCISSRQQPSCSVFHHVKVDVPIVLSVLSLKLGRSIRFDPQTESIVGDPEAARLAVPEYRAPWKFPGEYLVT